MEKNIGVMTPGFCALIGLNKKTCLTLKSDTRLGHRSIGLPLGH